MIKIFDVSHLLISSLQRFINEKEREGYVFVQLISYKGRPDSLIMRTNSND